MDVNDLTPEGEMFADVVQEGLIWALENYSEVGFATQISVIGIALGGILHQLPKQDRVRFTKMLVRHINDAPKFLTQSWLH